MVSIGCASCLQMLFTTAELKRRRSQQHQIVCPGCNASSKVGMAGAEWHPPQSPLKLQTRCRGPQDRFPETQPVPTVCMAPFAHSARLQKTLNSTKNTTFTTTLMHCMQQQGLQAGSCCKSKLAMSRIWDECNSWWHRGTS